LTATNVRPLRRVALVVFPQSVGILKHATGSPIRSSN
jgi:hypothetical protein